MQIRVPGSNQRNLKTLRQPRAENTRLTRSRDVHNVRTKRAQALFEEILMPYECRIEGEIFFNAKRDHAAAGDFQGGELPLLLFLDRTALLAWMETEERKIPSSGKGLKVAAGVGHPVDLVKRIRKVRHSRGRRAHRQSVSVPGRGEKCQTAP